MKKNFKNLKISSRLYFKTKRDRTGPKIENKKNFIPIRSNPTRVRNFKNKCKKILKIKKHHPGFISRRNGSGGPKNTKKKNSKNYRTSSGFHLKTKRVRTGRKIENKKISFLSVRSRPELENSKINA